MKDHITILKQHLNKIGISLTEEHKLIVNTVFDLHEHITDSKLTEVLEQSKIDQATIFETLNLMIEAGLIRKISFKENVYYEQVYGHAHHDHLICISCGKVVPFNSNMIEKEQLKIVTNNGFELIRHTLQIEGICSDCRKKRETATIIRDQKEDKTSIKAKELPLSMIPPGSKVEVVKISGGKDVVQRLLSMGIVSGKTVEVLANDFQGPFILKIENSRIGIGHGLCHKIMVRLILK